MWPEVVPYAVALAAAFGMMLFLRRYGGVAALEQLERANRVLGRRVTELEHENTELHAQVEVLRARTDVAEAFLPVKALLELQHAEAMECFGRMTTLLGMVADRLGPEPNGAEA